MHEFYRFILEKVLNPFGFCNFLCFEYIFFYFQKTFELIVQNYVVYSIILHVLSKKKYFFLFTLFRKKLRLILASNTLPYSSVLLLIASSFVDLFVWFASPKSAHSVLWCHFYRKYIKILPSRRQVLLLSPPVVFFGGIL